MKDSSVRNLEKQAKGIWQKFGFDHLLDTVYAVADLSENLDRRYWTVTTERLVNILKSERAKADKAETFKPPKEDEKKRR